MKKRETAGTLSKRNETEYKALEILRASGWYEGRSIDTSEMKENLKQLGYIVFPQAENFLKEFGDLVIEDIINDEIHRTNVKFTDYYANGAFITEEKFAKEKLIPVGKIDSEYLILLVSESGKIYCNTGKLGNNAIEAWGNLISGAGAQLWGFQ